MSGEVMDAGPIDVQQLEQLFNEDWNDEEDAVIIFIC
jgi:hypothetical protein